MHYFQTNALLCAPPAGARAWLCHAIKMSIINAWDPATGIITANVVFDPRLHSNERYVINSANPFTHTVHCIPEGRSIHAIITPGITTGEENDEKRLEDLKNSRDIINREIDFT